MSELTAALATIEKCREITGCPAGVSLQDWVKMLASELSVVEEIHNRAVFITDELYDASPKEVQSIIRSLACMKMPAYACLVAGIKADGVEMFAAEQRGVAERLQKRNVAAASRSISFCLESAEEAEVFAKQLREGAK